LSVRYFSDDIAFCIKNKRKITNLLKKIAETEAKKINNLSCIFVSDEKIFEMNQKYLNHDYYTDIITFNYSMSNTLINGEMYISINTVKLNANEYNVHFDIELLRVIIHGLLHLCGYKDDTEKQMKKMRKKETFYINLL